MPPRYVDPHKKRSRWNKANERVFGTCPGQFVVRHVLKAGGPKHPQWYHNLKAHPECELGDERFIATEVTDHDEYAQLYGLGELVYGGYSDYREKTAVAGRQIPVLRLTRR